MTRVPRPGSDFERHGAAVQLDQALDDRQAEAGAAMLGALAAALEALEHALLLLLRDADALVLDRERHHAGLAPAR